MKNENQIIIYTSPDNQTEVSVKMQDDTVWLTQAQMAELFDKDVRTINDHIKNIFAEGELDNISTIRKFRIVRREGQREVAREIEHYNLDAIISVGYRVNSKRGTLSLLDYRGTSSSPALFHLKDHPFTDGNKRIGAFLFIWFLEKNSHRFKENGEVKINDTGLTTLALLIAQSDPREKEMMIKLVINLINNR